MSTDTLVARRRPTLTEHRAVLLACGIVYLAVALWFWHNQVIPSDSTSRLANAYYTLFSRDPHLAAVGFVWNPLPSMILLPFLPLKVLLPALTQQSLLAPLVSAAFMTATVGIVHDLLRRMTLTRTPRLILTAAFALNPMTVLYAGNGMSEACFLLFLLLTTRALYQWLTVRKVESLVPAGLAVALAYGARYEALAPVVALPVVVALVTWLSGGDQRRLALARVDAVIAGLPGVLAVVLWAVASKIIVDQWFATFSSEYGNSAQVSSGSTGISSVTGDDLGGRLAYWSQQWLGIAPLLLVLLVLAAILAWRTRNPGILAPVTILGSVLAFDALAFLTGMSFGWLRFQITLIPLGVLLAGHVLATWRPLGTARAAVTLTLAALAVPSTLYTLTQPDLAREESEYVTAAGSARRSNLFHVDAQVAADLDAMNLPDGAILADAAVAYGVILASDHPHDYVTTPDRDFPGAVTDPRGHNIRYLLLSADAPTDAVRTGRYGPDAASVPTTGVRTWSDAYGNLQWTLIAA
ncbi:hypothetical protein [Winogradskya humida]|uniref:Dolichyl-phosphate-mannose-protein mannosyltransferase n=1 Tax=Winogradskya humida TaxID=113566 RepID=A0ABQ3ZZF5_9ACTN|nr:hypothetical protein [Actinoplanes humidus]GIE23753.1 hypothetical protein Ahu01nite_068550 [Actinoplanes humidus]